MLRPKHPLKRGVANSFVTEVVKVCGSTADADCNTNIELVEAKLEMVRAGGLFDCAAAVSRIGWINPRVRFQHDEIN